MYEDFKDSAFFYKTLPVLKTMNPTYTNIPFEIIVLFH